jgi:hypothetical protein
MMPTEGSSTGIIRKNTKKNSHRGHREKEEIAESLCDHVLLSVPDGKKIN